MFTFYQYIAQKWLGSVQNFNKNPLQSWSKLFLWTVDLTEIGFITDLYPVFLHSPHSKNMGSFPAATLVSGLHIMSPPHLSILSSLWGLLTAGVVAGFASNVWSCPFTWPPIYEKYRNIINPGASISLSNVAELNKYILKVSRYKVILYAC